MGAAALGQPPGFWVTSLASLGVIIGGVGPWATYLSYVSISGTSMNGWREVAAGVVGLVMLGVHQVRGRRVPLIIAAVAGVLGAIGAIDALNNIMSGGAVTVFGFTYRYLNAAWGIYLVLAGAIALALGATSLLWRSMRSSSDGADSLSSLL
jgi:hypothetical protein